MSNPDFIIIGKIGATYGIKGWLKITSYTEIKADILNYQPWYLENQGVWQPIQRIEGRPHGKQIIAQLTGYDIPEKARQLTGKNLAIPRSALPKLASNEYYWSDLQGLTVLNAEGKKLGTVAYLIATGSNDVLVIQNNQEEFAIPYLLNDIIIQVDLDQQIIQVNWE